MKNTRNQMKPTLALIVAIIGFLCSAYCQEKKPDYGLFSFEQKLTVPGSPEKTFDAITGDISGWWDHSFSEKPYKLYIEPKPGGGFYEMFNEKGDGVKHAEVIYADRGKKLRFDGPLGLSGEAIQMVCTYTFTGSGPDSTQLVLSVHAAGEIEDGIPALVESVWHHFLFDRFKPYVESGYKRLE